MVMPRDVFRRGTTRWICLTLAAVTVSSTLVSAQDDPHQTVRILSDGRAPGVTPASREAALRAAREKAVRVWIESMLGSPATAGFDPMMEYLDSYTASSRLTDVRVEEARTSVEAEIYLYERVLRTDLATVLLKRRAAPPSVALLLIENDQAANSRRFQEGTAMAAPVVEFLASRGIAVIDPAVARRFYGEREMLAVLESGPAALARFAADLNAEAVISIESRLSADDPGNGLGTVRCRASLNFLVVSAFDGAVSDKSSSVAELTAPNSATGLQFALDDALHKVRNRVVVAAVLAARGGATEHFDLSIEGVSDLRAAEQIAKELRRYHGVGKVDVLTARDGVARLRFQYSGRIGAIVEHLESGGVGPRMRAIQVVNREMQFRLDR